MRRREGRADSPLVLIKGALILDPGGSPDGPVDVLVGEGKVLAVEKGLSVPGADVLDAHDKLLMPGLIDLHVHLRDLGEAHKETVLTGTGAAALGGFTTVVNMPNTRPPLDSPEALEAWKAKARQEALVRVKTMVCLTVGRRGLELSPLETLGADPWVVGATDDGNPLPGGRLLREALEVSRRTGLLIASHPEDSPEREPLGPTPYVNEPYYVERDLRVLEEVGGRLHLQHLSMKESIPFVRRAKGRGLRVTCEVTPHHLCLFDQGERDPNFKVNPPLRGKEDVEALREALVEGLIDVIATDHAPHASEEKERGWADAPFGISGLETALSLLWTELVMAGYIDPLHLVTLTSWNPARILGLPPPRISPGSRADLCLFDPHLRWKVVPRAFFSKGKNTPLAGRELQGKVWATICGGRVVVRDGRLVP